MWSPSWRAGGPDGGPGCLSWPGAAGADDHQRGGRFQGPAAGLCAPRASYNLAWGDFSTLDALTVLLYLLTRWLPRFWLAHSRAH